MARPSSRVVRLLVLGLLSTMAGLSACGSSSGSKATSGESSKSANQIFADAKKATGGASSVHIFGHITSGSDKTDLDFVDSSVRSGGTITDSGATIQVIVSGKTLYLMGSAASMAKLTGDQAAGQLLGGKWLETTKDNKDFGSLAQLFDLTNLVKDIQPQGTLQKRSVTTINGQSVIGLTDASRKGTLYVASSGPPYMIELVGGPGETGTITFDNYGSAKPPTIPKNPINLDQLESGSGA